MGKSRASKERRDARRKRDREWCEVRLVLLRIAHGWDQFGIDRLRSQFPTKGMMRNWLTGRVDIGYLAKDKLHVSTESQAQ